MLCLPGAVSLLVSFLASAPRLRMELDLRASSERPGGCAQPSTGLGPEAMQPPNILSLGPLRGSNFISGF